MIELKSVYVCRGRPTDMYALGACLYTFVFGRIPFNAPNVFKLFQIVQNEPLSFPARPAVSPLLQDLLLRLLHKVARPFPRTPVLLSLTPTTDSISISPELLVSKFSPAHYSKWLWTAWRDTKVWSLEISQSRSKKLLKCQDLQRLSLQTFFHSEGCFCDK